MTTFSLRKLGHVNNSRTTTEDDDWAAVTSRIVLETWVPEEALHGLTDFSHVEVLFVFHLVDEEKPISWTRHPRGNTAWPSVGILAQRGKDRPNRLGLCTAKIAGVEGRALLVEGLDAIDGTPVLDLKPVMQEFLPRG